MLFETRGENLPKARGRESVRRGVDTQAEANGRREKVKSRALRKNAMSAAYSMETP
jgi:hypothetical protein